MTAFLADIPEDANANGENSPTGVAQALTHAEVVTSAGSYDAYTGSTSRTVPDLIVPGGVGGYPLAFSRTSTSRYVPGDDGDGGSFGPSGSWRHSYRWGIYIDNPGQSPTVWRLHYPNGEVVKFTIMSVAKPTPTSPTPPADSFLHSQSPGVQDRLAAANVNSNPVLHRKDGGTVVFTNLGNGAFQLTAIYDPYGQKTTFAYYASGTYSGKLQQVTEPGGRWLQFGYATYNGGSVLQTVSASNGQSVTYNYSIFSGTTYTALSSVTYNSDTNASNQPYTATYTYQADNTGAGLRPLLYQCSDPHFPGPMPRMRYQYVQSASVPYGQIQAEIDDASGAVVSSYNQNSDVETRGDGPTSSYGYSSYLLSGTTDYDGDNTQYSYDANSFLDGITNANGHTVTVTRDPYAGKRTAIIVTDTNGQQLTTAIDYGSTAQTPYPVFPYWVMHITDPRGNVTTFTRDGNERVTNIAYADGTSEGFTYNGYGEVATHKGRDGGVHTFAYNSSGSLSTATDSINSPAGLYTHYYYDSVGRLSQVTDFNGHNTWYSYTGGHLLTQVKHDDGKSINYTYDGFGNPSTATDENLKETTFTYDNHRRPTSITVPVNSGGIASRTTTFSYERGSDTTGNANTQRGRGTTTLQSGKQEKRIYTGQGRLRSVTEGYGNPDATTDTFYYDGVGHPLRSIDANSITQATYTYDVLERKSSLTDANGHVTTWTYYPAGSTVSPGGWTSAGLLETIKAPGSGIGLTATTQYAYDQFGRQTSETDPSGNTTGNSYDASGRLSSVSDANGPYTYSYDALSRPLWLTFPDNTSQGWTYDPVGNPLTCVNRAGFVRTNQYDDRNRLTEYTWNDGVTSPKIWTYDAANRVTALYNWRAKLQYTYDDSGLVMSESDLNYEANNCTNVTSYTRDVDGNIVLVQYPAGDQAPYSYDDQNRCFEFGNASTAWSQLSFRGELVSSRALINNVTTEYSHQTNDRINQVWHHHGGPNPTQSGWPSTNISTRRYGYAPDGQITWSDREPDSGVSGSSLEDGQGENYAYGADNSLTAFGMLYANTYANSNSQGDCAANPTNLVGAPGAGGSGSYASSYQYDASGNRANVTQFGAGNTAYGANDENQYGGSVYDTNGETTNSLVGWTYAYDAEGEMTSATRSSDSFTVSFKYDGLGRLVYQNTGTATIFCYAGNQRIEERVCSTNVSLYRYFFDAPGSDSIVFRQTSNGVEDGGTRVYYQYDAVGNTTHLSDDSGNILEQYLYDSYGTPYVYNGGGTYLGQQSGQDNRYLFRGASAYEWLPLPALYYCRARMYLPFHGRFLVPDPSGFGGGDVNLYRYCGNDPVNNTDASGLDWDDDSSTPLQTDGLGLSIANLQVTNYTPTGSHIPDVTYDQGPFSVLQDAVNGDSILGLSTAIQTAMASKTYEGYDMNGIYARATAVYGPTPPVPAVTLALPGFGGQYDGTVGPNGGPSNAIFHQGVGNDAFVVDRDNLQMGVDYAENMLALGSPSVNVIGYSLGGPAAIALSALLGENGITVNSLATIDPVMIVPGSLSVPSNVQSALNYYQQSGGLKGLLPGSSFGNFGGTYVNGAFNQLALLNTTHQQMPASFFQRYGGP